MNIQWSDAENNFIKENAGIFKDTQLVMEIQRVFGKQVKLHQVTKQRQRLGIKKQKGRGICKVVS
jgi:hypothetical protein